MSIEVLPNPNELWQGIAGYFDTISQVLSEFIDNSISNFKANQSPIKSIQVSLKELNENEIEISVEDTGTGIKNLKPCLTLGDKSAQETPLNEHGFGLKHALASANPSNDKWIILTRTKDDYENGIYKKVESPYAFSLDIKNIKVAEEKWPGLFNGSGTYIKFVCSRQLFNTIQTGIPGVAGFDRCIDYLIEELGYTYSGVISSGNVTIVISGKNGNKALSVPAVLPEWVDFYSPGCNNKKLDLSGKGRLTTVYYEFGEMRQSKQYIRHYQRNMSTSGVELRINGRLIIDNLFTEIWGLEKHNSYNHFLVRINLEASSLECLPKTRTSKNSIRPDDPILNGLFEWIRKTCPEPHEKLSSKVSEDQLVEKLENGFSIFIKDETKHIEREFSVFRNIGSPLPVDLYVFDGKQVRLYEAKKDRADVQAIYQLLMYWDGLVSDGQHPDQGVLIATDFSDGVDEIISKFNNRKDEEGNNYCFVKTTWREEGVEYPET